MKVKCSCKKVAHHAQVTCIFIEDVMKGKDFKTMLKYKGLSKKTQVGGFKAMFCSSFSSMHCRPGCAANASV